MTYIVYLRVSTDRQHASGLGLEAQREAVERYAAAQAVPIRNLYVEAESGKLYDRPQLTAALAECRKHRATLLVAKLDRLARNVAFVSALMETGVEFVAVDAPYANKLMLHILSAFAQHEREQISERTKAALAAAKARGVKLGAHGIELARLNRRAAMEFAKSTQAAIEEAQEQGHLTFRAIACYLTDRGIETATAARWHPTTVRRNMVRLGMI